MPHHDTFYNTSVSLPYTNHQFATYSIQLVLERAGRVGDTITEGPHMWAGASSFPFVGPSELACKVYVSFLDHPNIYCRTLKRGTITNRSFLASFSSLFFPQLFFNLAYRTASWIVSRISSIFLIKSCSFLVFQNSCRSFLNRQTEF